MARIHRLADGALVMALMSDETFLRFRDRHLRGIL
jgi:hypothetical protein